MKKTILTFNLILFLVLSNFTVFAQKGVWVPAGGDIDGFQIATTVYKNNLYVSGIDYQSSIPKSYIKKFNGLFWTTVVELKGYNNSISEMIEYKGELFVGGQFNEFDGVTNANGIVKWNGSKWSAVGNGFNKSSFAQVNAFEVFNNKLYIGGRFDTMPGLGLKNMAIWDGSGWAAGPKIESSAGMYTIVQGLKTLNSNLYIGGTFEKVNNIDCKNVARYDGTNVYSLSNGSSNGTNSEVIGFEIFKNELYLYGYFSMLDTVSVSGIAKWDNSRLLKLADQPGASVQSVKALGNYLYCAGAGFNSSIEYFDGSKWDKAGETTLQAEGGKLEVFKNKLYVFSGFMTSDSSSFVFAGSAMLIDAADVCKAEGVIYLDTDKSCTKSSNEKGISGRIIEIKPLGIKAITDSSGYFSVFLEKGSYTAKMLPYAYFAGSCGDSINFTFTSLGEKTDTLFFGSYVKDTVFDARVKIASSAARPGFPIQYYVTTINKGTSSQNCVLKVVFDNNFTFSSVKGVAYSRYSGNTMEWDLTNFKPDASFPLTILGTVKSSTSIGTRMKTYVEVVPSATDANMTNNVDTAVNFVRGSFDPNDKQVYPSGLGINGFVGKNTNLPLRYTIRFQNTGNDTAFNIFVIDTLSDNLNPATFEVVGTSHPYSVELLSGKVLKFTFNNILLVDSNTSVSLSQGSLTFDISPKTGLAIGSIIRNNADIYFDFNDPVRTNTTITTFDNAASVGLIQIADNIKVYPNPGNGKVMVELGKPIGSNENVNLQVTDLQGRIIKTVNLNEEVYELDLTSNANAIYILKVQRGNGGVANFRYIKTN